MGTHRSGSGGDLPPDGDRSRDDRPKLPELPELPPDVAVPDDLSELADEAERVRQELAQEKAEPGWRHRPDASPPGEAEPSIGVPLLIMSVAVLITLISLFALAWTGTDDPQPAPALEPLPPVTLTGAGGQPETVTAYAPTVIMLVEMCECAGLLSDTVAAAPAGVTVIAVGGDSAPAPPTDVGTGNPGLLRLADPDAALRTELGLGPPTGDATVVLVNQDREITHINPSAASVSAYQAELTTLAGG